MLVGTFYLTSLIFVLVVLGAVAWWNGFSILKLIRYLKEELLLVLGTSSSEAALPVADGEAGARRLPSARSSAWSSRPAIPSTSTAPTST